MSLRLHSLKYHCNTGPRKLVEANRKDFKGLTQKIPKESSTAIAAWDTILEETSNVSKHHEAIAENLTKNVSCHSIILYCATSSCCPPMLARTGD